MNRTISDTGAQLVARFEGFRSTAYKDAAGVWTIGYGHTGYVKFFKKNVCSGMTITHEQSLELLKDDLSKFETVVNKYDSKYTWNQNEFDALVSFAFNIGSIDQLTANGMRTRAVIAEKIVLYISAGGNELPGLVTRRKAEQELFLYGVVDTETELPESNSLTAEQKASNLKTVQAWLNENYGDDIKTCKLCGYRLLEVDGKNGNKTRAALTIALQVYINELGARLAVDGDYGTKTNAAVQTYIKYVGLGNDTMAAKIVQAILYAYGYNPQLFYADFTNECVIALEQCQDDKNLNADGKAGIIFFTTFLKQR